MQVERRNLFGARPSLLVKRFEGTGTSEINRLADELVFTLWKMVIERAAWRSSQFKHF